MQAPLQVAIVGCGMVSAMHVQAIRAQENTLLAGVYDHLPEMAAQKAVLYQTRCYPSYEDLLADPAVDAVAICTPSGLHAQQALQALDAGKHVLIEKPIALNLTASDRISEKESEKKLLVSVVSQLRFSQAVIETKKDLEAGRLGRIVSADLYMKYHRPQSYYDQTGWRGTFAMDGGGALMNQGIHGVDLLSYLLGPLHSITAHARTLTRQIEVEDTLAAVVSFRSGALGVIQATTSVFPGFPRRLEINGDKGSIMIVEDTVMRRVILGEPEMEEAGPDSRHQGHNNPMQISAAGHIAQYKNFLAAIRKEAPLLVDDQDGRRALEIIVKAYESSRDNRIVYFP